MKSRIEDNFYEDLTPFTEFEDLTRENHYRTVPENWSVFVTDVVNSSEAIRDGRYRDVNKLGAATITTVQNVLTADQFPFTFGGDGASVVLPESVNEPVQKNLAGLRALARENFDLDLRVGTVSVQDLHEENVSLEVAKYQLAPDRYMAFFRGGGIRRASEKTKSHRDHYRVEAPPRNPLDLENLSCRWKPIPNENGTILSILVQSRRAEENPVYRSILQELDELLDRGLAESNPVNTSTMSYRSFREILEDEIRYETSLVSFSFLTRFFEIILAVLIFHLGFNPGLINVSKYLQETRGQSDFRTFDDMLRLTVDCTPEERDGIESRLESYRENGDIFYGLHESDHSLMTCFVQQLKEGGHLHFIDGAKGGYTRAALQLKDQVEAEQNNS